jgi:hypothetical protein
MKSSASLTPFNQSIRQKHEQKACQRTVLIQYRLTRLSKGKEEQEKGRQKKKGRLHRRSHKHRGEINVDVHSKTPKKGALKLETVRKEKIKKGSARAMRVFCFCRIKSRLKQNENGKNDRQKNAPLRGASIGQLGILLERHFQGARVDCECFDAI